MTRDDIIRMASGVKACIHCAKLLTLESFRKSARMRGGRENGCKDCHNNRRRIRYTLNPQPTLERNRKWSQANRPALSAYHKKWNNQEGINRRTLRRRIEINTLSDSYIRQLLSGKLLHHSDIPDLLVQAHREVLKIKRFLNEKRH